MYSDEDEDDDSGSNRTGMSYGDEDADNRSDGNVEQEIDEFGNIAGGRGGSGAGPSGASQALEAMDDVEIIVQEEDTEPITQPIVKPIIIKRFSHHVSNEKHGLPRTTFDFKFLHKMMEQDHAIRNIAIIGHLLHGKTSFVDCIVEQTHLDFEGSAEKPIRFTDTLFAEQERGISIKCSPLSIVHQSLRNKSYLLNIMDTPGHVNFSDEVTAALRLCDGVVLVVDAVEGIMMNTERLLIHALREGMAITLCINKIDRLIFELRLPPNDAYHKIKRIIDEVNILIDDESRFVSPLLGNVCFASSQYSVCFTLKSFAKLYLERYKTYSITYRQFASKLWGNLYLDGETSKFVKEPPTKASKRSFVEFILEPLYKFFRLAIEDPGEQFLEVAEKYKIKLNKKQKGLNVRPLLRLACSQLFGTFESFVDMVAEFVPTPKYNAPSKCPLIWSGPMVNCDLTRAIRECDPKGPLIVHVTKQYSSQDATSFNVMGLVLSGTLKSDTHVNVLGESYSAADEEDSEHPLVGKIWINNSRYTVDVRSIPAGNWALIEGLDEAYTSKTATIIDSDYSDDLYIFKPLRFNTKSVIKIAVDPVNPSEKPKMTAGLNKCKKSYPLLQVRKEEGDEYVMIGTGELYLDCVLHDLRHMYSEIDIRVSDPTVCFSETVIGTSCEKCVGETPNKQNQLTMIAEPMEKNLDIDLEQGRIFIDSDQRDLDKFFKRRYKWDDLACRSIWAFGPETNSTNILFNDTLPYEVDGRLLNDVKAPILQAFDWVTREGPLCGEPIRGVRFKLIHADISEEPTYRPAGQIIPTARKVAYLSFLQAEPRLMEPYMFIEIIAPSDVVRGAIDSSGREMRRSLLEDIIVEKRRGKITKREEIPGTPLYRVNAIMPAIDSFGFETDLRVRTTGQAFCMSTFDEWRIVPGDPLDDEIDKYLTPLEPQRTEHLAREFLLKTRQRKGITQPLNVERFKMK